jgi:hypothetical protein
MDKTLEERLQHVKYEYAMASFCIYELERETRQAWWNALLAAFVVYWRNGRAFLKGDDEQETIKAWRYVVGERFRPTSLGPLEKEAGAICPEVLHLGFKRHTEDEKKFGLEGARKLMAWLVENFNQFEAALEEPYKSIWLRQEEVGENKVKLTASNTIQVINWTSAIGELQIVGMEFAPVTNKKGEG